MTVIAKNIRYLRKRHNMSQEQLAMLLDKKNYTTIQKWESDVSEPTLGSVEKMAAFFHVNIDDFVKVDLEIEDSKPLSERATTRVKKWYDALNPAEADVVKQIAYLNDDARDSILHQISYEYEKEKRKSNGTSA